MRLTCLLLVGFDPFQRHFGYLTLITQVIMKYEGREHSGQGFVFAGVLIHEKALGTQEGSDEGIFSPG